MDTNYQTILTQSQALEAQATVLNRSIALLALQATEKQGYSHEASDSAVPEVAEARTSALREALKIVQQEGFVQSCPGSSATVPATRDIGTIYTAIEELIEASESSSSTVKAPVAAAEAEADKLRRRATSVTGVGG